jgi:hypothetical protein
MTELNKAIRRECRNTFEQHRPIIVSLEPGDIITFRQKSCRTVWKTTIQACFHMAVKADVLAKKRSKTK